MLSLPTWAVFVGVFAVGFAVSWGLTPVAGALSRRLGLVDKPGGRRRHQGAIPRLGGIAVFGGFMVAVLLTLPYPRSAADAYRLTGLLFGCTVVFIGGLLDDRLQLKPLPILGFILVAALIACRYWVFIERVNNPLTNQPQVFSMPVTILLTLLWLAGMTNTVNLLDGLDGLAAGVCAIAVLVFFVHMVRTGQDSVALLPLALLGALLGFLPHNLHPARIFLGGGAYFLGYAVGALSIIGGARAATALLVLAVPILDVAWMILYRARNRRSPGTGDRAHLHFRLVDLGIPQEHIVLLYYALSAAFGGLALIIPSRLYKLLALIVLGVVIVIVLAIVSRIGDQRERSRSQDF